MKATRPLLALSAALWMAAGCTGRTTPLRPPSPSPRPEPPVQTPAPSPVVTPEPAPTPEPLTPTRSVPTPPPSPASPGPRPAPTPSEVATGGITGTLELLTRDGKKEPATDAVVWIPGLRRGTRSVPRLEQRDKTFQPHVVVVGKGGRVAFPNLDRVFHNVFSATPGNRFDLGLYKRGMSKEWVFNNPGEVRVFCNIHPEMTGYVLVLDETDPVFAVSDATGRVHLSDLPAGSRRVRLWHEKGGEQELTLDVAAGRETPFGVLLDGSHWKKEPHKNKHGEDYPKGNRAYP